MCGQHQYRIAPYIKSSAPQRFKSAAGRLYFCIDEKINWNLAEQFIGESACPKGVRGGAGVNKVDTESPPPESCRHSQSLTLADCPGVPPPSATLTPPPHCGRESIASPCSALAACRRRCRKAVSALRRLDICGGAANIIRSSGVVGVGAACDLGYVVRRPKRLRRRGSSRPQSSLLD